MGIWIDPVRVRAVVRADVGAGTAAFGANHAVAERLTSVSSGQMIGVHRAAVIALDRSAIDQ
jgi:hypothetical protein